MFTGITKALSPVTQVSEQKEELKINIQCPEHKDFTNLKTGDSVAVDGVCLTLERISSTDMQFHLGHETLKITKWSADTLKNKLMNLEPSLKMGDSIGGHFVTGHVDGLAQIIHREEQPGGSVLIKVQLILKESAQFLQKKFFITLNGVSLTINEVYQNENDSFNISICLVPETLKRTNLHLQKTGDYLTFELDRRNQTLV